MGRDPDDAAEIREQVLPAYPGWDGASFVPFGNGLINRTYLLTAAGVTSPGSGSNGTGAQPGARAVLQRVSPIFSPAIHDNILAVTRRLAEAGMVTPRLVPTRQGEACWQRGDAVWRILTYVPGVSFDVIGEVAQARAAGELIARFHQALRGLDHTFVGRRVGVHDTAAHLARLDEALGDHPGHRLAGAVGALATEIRAGARALPALPSLSALPPLVGHGDLKFNNILFAGSDGAASQQPVCLIDLDVVGPLPLSFELGDAWRSWCNRASEDDVQAVLDLEIFRASQDGYRQGRDRALTADERAGLLLGVEWVSLGLAARFAADAVRESYFGWDARRFPGRGEHNLVRARGQWSLHQLLVASRPARATLLEQA